MQYRVPIISSPALWVQDLTKVIYFNFYASFEVRTYLSHVLLSKIIAYTLNMTSQRWLTDADFSVGSQSGSIWWHYVVVIVPDNIQYTQNATLWITGGGMGDSAPHGGQEDIVVSAALATNTGVITGVLYQVRISTRLYYFLIVF